MNAKLVESRIPKGAWIAIGTVRSERKAMEDDGWDAVSALIELDDSQFKPEALGGLEDFSHVEVIFLTDRVEPSQIERGARHPRNDKRLRKVGIFAQRGKDRPNQIGTTICRVDSIEGLKVHVTGLDAIDGTPVLDLKPCVREFGPRGAVRQPAWMDELMKSYWTG